MVLPVPSSSEGMSRVPAVMFFADRADEDSGCSAWRIALCHTHSISLVLPVGTLTDFVGLILFRSCAGSHSCSKLMGAMAVSYPGDNALSLRSSPFSAFYSSCPCVCLTPQASLLQVYA